MKSLEKQKERLVARNQASSFAQRISISLPEIVDQIPDSRLFEIRWQ